MSAGRSGRAKGGRGFLFKCLRAALHVLAVVLTTFAARAQVVRTWGAPAEPEPTTSPSPERSPPPPPPSTIGVPVDPSGEAGFGAPSQGGAAVVPLSVAGREAASRAGRRYVLDGVEVRGNKTTLARVVLRYVPFRAGDVLDVDDKELVITRFRLLGTGFFRDVRLSLRKGSQRGAVVLVVEVIERNTFLVNDLWLGLSADAEPDGSARPLTAYGGIDAAETNLAGSGITLGGALAFADRQLALRSRFIDPQFLGSPWGVEAHLLFNDARDFLGNRGVLVDYAKEEQLQDYAILNYKRFGGLVGTSHDIGNAARAFAGYRLERIEAGVPLAASHTQSGAIVPIDFRMIPGASVLSSLRALVAYDTRDELVLPHRGVHATLLADLSFVPLGSDYSYAKLVARASRWVELPWRHVLRFEGFGGAIIGRAPLFENFYVGDLSDLLPDRVLELNFDRRASPNFFGTRIGEIRHGELAVRLATEYRVPLYRGKRSVYGADLFAGVGLFALADQPSLTRTSSAYRGLAQVPFDLTFNVGLRIDTAAGGFTLGLSNLLGFLPVRRDAP